MVGKIKDLGRAALGLALLVLAMLTSPIWIPLSMAFRWRCESRQRQIARLQGRVIPWKDLLSLSENGQRGTLIFEQAQKMPLRLWWTPDENIEERSPVPIPAETEIDYVSCEADPFMKWIHEHYTGPTGTALLTNHTPRTPCGFAEVSHLQETGFHRIIPAVRLRVSPGRPC